MKGFKLYGSFEFIVRASLIKLNYFLIRLRLSDSY